MNTVANALAKCAQTPSACSTLFNTAQNSTGGAAKNMLDAINNILTVSGDATPIYNFGLASAATTGFTPQNLTPTILSIPMPAGRQSYTTVSTTNLGIEIDAGGNVWVCNFGSNSISQFSPSGAILGTFPLGPLSLGIDAAGNVWTSIHSGFHTVEINSSGTVLGTFSGGGQALAIDASGNVWVLGNSSSNSAEFSPSGTVLLSGIATTGAATQNGIAIDAQGNPWISGNISVNHISGSSGAALQTYPLSTSTRGITIDSSGHVWVLTTAGTVVELSSGGGLLNTFSSVTNGGDARLKFDSAGNLWICSSSGSTMTELSPTGATIGTYTFPVTPRDMAIDQNGNVWVLGNGGTSLFEIQNVTQGPTFFPFSGPIYSGSG